jgi:Zn-dependent peptidase ImmA (M78 family)
MSVRRKLIRSLVQNLLTTHNIIEPPVDVDGLAQGLGLTLRRHAADPDLSGFILREGNGPGVVGVNKNHAKNRQRFTVAHEIAHFLLHPSEPVHVDKGYQIKLRDASSGEGVDTEEKEANLFAAELLIPAHFLAADISQLHGVDLSDEDQIKKLARRYEVSPLALGYRLAYLGYS